MLRKAVMRSWTSLEGPARRFDRFLRLAQKELHSPVKIGLGDRLRMWRRGFLGESLAIYGLDRNDPAAYVTDFQRHVRTPDLNGRYRFVLQDKLLFGRLMQSFPAHAVPSFGVIHRGRMRFVRGSDRNAATYLRTLLRSHPALVVKPLAGGGGEQIRILRRDGDGLLVNEKPLSASGLERLVAGMRQNLVTPFIEQRTELATLYPRTANTLRLLSMWEPETGEPFLAAAVQRIGRAACYPADNWTQGGLSARVELDSGVLGPGVSHPAADGRLAWHDSHPDSGAAIAGFALPDWEAIHARMLEICRSLPFLTYVGWDLILTEDGFKILEGNHYPDLNLMQVHRPLLSDSRVRRFYESQGVIPGVSGLGPDQPTISRGVRPLNSQLGEPNRVGGEGTVGRNDNRPQRQPRRAKG